MAQSLAGQRLPLNTIRSLLELVLETLEEIIHRP